MTLLSEENKKYIEDRLDMLSILGSTENSRCLQVILDDCGMTSQPQVELSYLMTRFRKVLTNIHHNNSLDNEVINIIICIASLDKVKNLEWLELVYFYEFEYELTKSIIAIKDVVNPARMHYVLDDINCILDRKLYFDRIAGSKERVRLGKLELISHKSTVYWRVSKCKKITIVTEAGKTYSTDNIFLSKEFIAIQTNKDEYIIISLNSDKIYQRNRKYVNKHTLLHIIT